jgi:soluble lytic murein transglycosylase
MRFFAVLLFCMALSAPIRAQSVDPAAIAAIIAREDPAAQVAVAPDPLTADVLIWLQLRAGGPDLASYQRFFAMRPDWPSQQLLRRASEAVITPTDDPRAVIAWFAQDVPQTGEGALALARAHLALGDADAATAVLRRAWRDLALTQTAHAAMLADFADQLAADHGARVDALLWRGRRADAARMLPLLPKGQAALAAARLGYGAGQDDMTALLAAVPADLRNDPGLAYARFTWLTARNDLTEATAVLRAQSVSGAALVQPERWSSWRRVLARWHMREGRADLAYEVAVNHFLTQGEAFVDLEWLAGYLALTYLDDPAAALMHFDTALQVVSGPISLARLHYWTARVHDAMGQPALARDAWVNAAQHQTAFYGLLAAERLGLPIDPAVVGATPAPWRGAAVFDDDLVRAALLLLAADERGAAVSFFSALGDRLAADDLAALGAYLAAQDEAYFTLLLGKTAVGRGLILPALYFPVHDLAQMDLPVDPALAMAIARRESEFNIAIASPVGALGLMQVMPATAQEVAGWLDLPYALGRLTSDWRYNATLGAAYLAHLQDQFGPSPVMIAAGYNAGPSRPRAWISERGDPRLGQMDVIDWIEHIPFRETRNYVQRVTESLMIYRAILSGQGGPVVFTPLLTGQKPVLRPVPRPVSRPVGG